MIIIYLYIIVVPKYMIIYLRVVARKTRKKNLSQFRANRDDFRGICSNLGNTIYLGCIWRH